MFFIGLFNKNNIKSSQETCKLKVSVLIPAFNEELGIKNKIKNLVKQDYPKNKLEIIIASDGSHDRTVIFAKSFRDDRIKILDSQNRRGKNAVLNDAVKMTSGDILIFTDANAHFKKDSVKQLVDPFIDPKVGLVCGHLKYIKKSEDNVAEGEGLYFRYEAFIKNLESELGVLPVVTGAIYAIRRDLFTELENEVANDFAHPLQVGAEGYKVVFASDAIAFEKATESNREEFWRRVRIVNRGFTAIFKYWGKYNIYRGLRGFTYLSHKLLRWFVPLYLLSFFIINLFLLDAVFFKITFLIQVIFYLLAILGIFLKGKLFAIPFYFCLINIAALLGFLHFLFGKRFSIWEIANSTR